MKWGAKEMERVKKAIAIPGTPWELASLNEFKIKRANLTPAALVWFNFIKHSVLPTSHATTVEKERMILLDAILGGNDIDVGRLICREIAICHSKTAGYLFYPCLITSLSVAAGVEIKGEDKSYPLSPFPTVLKGSRVAAASIDPTMLPQLILHQKAMWEFQRKQHEWLVSIITANVEEAVENMPPVFPDWIVREAEVNVSLEEEELPEEVVPEESKKRKWAAVKKGKQVVEEEEEEFVSDEGSSSEKEEEMEERKDESEEEDETKESEEEEEIQCDTPPPPPKPTKSTTIPPTTVKEKQQPPPPQKPTPKQPPPTTTTPMSQNEKQQPREKVPAAVSMPSAPASSVAAATPAVTIAVPVLPPKDAHVSPEKEDGAKLPEEGVMQSEEHAEEDQELADVVESVVHAMEDAVDPIAAAMDDEPMAEADAEENVPQQSDAAAPKKTKSPKVSKQPRKKIKTTRSTPRTKPGAS